MMVIITLIISIILIFLLYDLMGGNVFVILSIGWILLIWKAIRSAKKENERQEGRISTARERLSPKLDRHGKLIIQFNVNYLGGHPSYNTKSCIMKFYNEVIVLLDYYSNSYAEIYYKDISDVDLVSKEYITQNPTLDKFLIFGMASLAMQEEKIHTNDFIIISYSDTGINNKVIIKTVEASKIYNTINRCRINYNKTHEKDYKNNELGDISEKIRKLSSLKNKGILTEDEFKEKKKELLSKM